MSLKTISVLSFLVAIAAMFGLIYPPLLSGHRPGEFGNVHVQSNLFGTGPVSIGRPGVRGRWSGKQRLF